MNIQMVFVAALYFFEPKIPPLGVKTPFEEGLWLVCVLPEKITQKGPV